MDLTVIAAWASDIYTDDTYKDLYAMIGLPQHNSSLQIVFEVSAVLAALDNVPLLLPGQACWDQSSAYLFTYPKWRPTIRSVQYPNTAHPQSQSTILTSNRLPPLWSALGG